ncbi:hypothetical protein [uncultured Sphingorhabdus sp.]|uniref:hypothetical protein n=1 Tax=uncultured Sphingorhabdus sp. TaxID=1686106 RepID=UPI002631BEB5|nr:hypothetical protein [uncultured Sphingorhabdus sp.]HMS19221.1 hypothetical protein [Sphingorhabdus sp.]
MLRSVMAAAIIFAVPASAIAQSYNSSDLGRPSDKKISLGLTVPFGNGGKAQERKPRLELGFDHRANRQSVAVVGTELKDLNNQKARIGLSLSKDPHLMLNGREVPKVNGRYNMSTAAWIGIGLVAAAGVGVVVVWQMAEANSE